MRIADFTPNHRKLFQSSSFPAPLSWRNIQARMATQTTKMATNKADQLRIRLVAKLKDVFVKGVSSSIVAWHDLSSCLRHQNVCHPSLPSTCPILILCSQS